MVFKIRFEFKVKTFSSAMINNLIFKKNKLKDIAKLIANKLSNHDRMLRQAAAKMRLRKDNNLTKMLISCKYKAEAMEIQSKF
jgi:hypothetical protein